MEQGISSAGLVQQRAGWELAGEGLFDSTIRSSFLAFSPGPRNTVVCLFFFFLFVVLFFVVAIDMSERLLLNDLISQWKCVHPYKQGNLLSLKINILFAQSVLNKSLHLKINETINTTFYPCYLPRQLLFSCLFSFFFPDRFPSGFWFLYHANAFLGLNCATCAVHRAPCQLSRERSHGPTS